MARVNKLTRSGSVGHGNARRGACSVAASGPASGTGSSATFTIVFNIDSTRFYGAKAISAFVVEQSGIVTSQPIPGVTIPQNQ